MKCPQCQFENPERMNFCGMCGNPLTTLCLKCGQSNPIGTAFCDQYDTKIEPKKSVPAYVRWRYTTRLMIAMGELYFHKEDRKKSLYFIRRAFNMAQKNGAKKHRAQALLIRGKLLSKTRPSQASQSFKDALDLSQKMGTRLLSERIRQAQKEL